MDKIILFKDKKHCCGCEACANICPQQAIEMIEDEYGYKYPQINHEKCIGCGLCKRTCAYQNECEFNENEDTYVGITDNEEILMKSASGGIFAQIATNIIKQNGIVYGCSLEKENGKLTPKHIRIDNLDELEKLQGSKYVQSDINDTYKLIKEDLKSEKIVLFSGTPCQVSALKNFIGNKHKGELYTIDIICHGIPNKKIFQDYISFIEQKENVKVTNFIFRDKTKGWGLQARLDYIDNSNKTKYKLISSHLSSYYQLFLDSEIYRENCYSCKYAGKKRVGDITIGDFWGIEKEHPEYLKDNGGDLNEKNGISCILVNNEIGKEIIEKYCNDLSIMESKFEKAARQNKQLNHPSIKSKNREKILETFRERGYKGIDSWYFKKIGVKKYIYCVWEKIPRKYKLKLKK